MELFIATYFIINAFIAGVHYGDCMRFSVDPIDVIGIIIGCVGLFLFGLILIVFNTIYDFILKPLWNKANYYLALDAFYRFYFTDIFDNLTEDALYQANMIAIELDNTYWYNRLQLWLINKINQKNDYTFIKGNEPKSDKLGIDEELLDSIANRDTEYIPL